MPHLTKMMNQDEFDNTNSDYIDDNNVPIVPPQDKNRHSKPIMVKRTPLLGDAIHKKVGDTLR